MIALTATGSRHTSLPVICTVPASGRSSPVIIDSVVVFPAPFGPTRPKKLPGGTSRFTPATATLSPNRFHRPRATRAAAGPADLAYAWDKCRSPRKILREPAGRRMPTWPNLSGMTTQVLPPAEDAPQPDPHTTAGKIADLEKRRYEAIHAGSQRAVERQHGKGKMTARERIDGLLDPGSFTELDELARHRATDFGVAANRPYGDGVVTGYGTVDGRPVCVFSQDFTVFGGSLGEVYGEKIVKLMDHALKTGGPLIGI